MNALSNGVPSASIIAKFTAENGFFAIPSRYYFKEQYLQQLLQLQQAFYKLEEDPYGGSRWRSRASFTFSRGKITHDPPSPYIQDKDDNYQEKGRPRYFEQVSDLVLDMPLFQELLNADLEIAKATGEVDFEEDLEIGIHMVRYAPRAGETSDSSPRWLHKDTEPVVFIHLVNLSGNALGGENIISHDAKFSKDYTMVRLSEPLDTLLLNRLHFHAVVPLMVGFGEVAYRDVLLITFDKKKRYS